ncbi:FAD-dependent oxidoreductase [Eubacteriaceae bacterium ES3]|nr:FAD-dependent oxidoreductase [Eubacteriaceae bacterium ES3]
MTEYRVFKSLKINQIELKNSLFMAPISVAIHDNRGAYSNEIINFYKSRAAGGAGLIITGANEVGSQHAKACFYPSPLVDPQHFKLAAKSLADGIHQYDSKVFAQLAVGIGDTDLKNLISVCSNMAIKSLQALAADFSQAAKIFKDSGFDGVEVSLSWLLEGITLFNDRDDKYGGSIENRYRIVKEIIREIKAKCGEDYPVIVRLPMKSFLKDGNLEALPEEVFLETGRDLAEALEVARILEAGGCDGFDIDAGVSINDSYWKVPPAYFEKGVYLDFGKELKKTVKVPVLAAGKMTDPELLEKALKEKNIDGVGLGRPLLADSDYPKKLKEGMESEIRPCLFCNECLSLINNGKRLGCAVNPELNYVSDAPLGSAKTKKKIIVVGGGPAGMETARVSALCGHQVILFESGEELGGKLKYASQRILRTGEHDLINWYVLQLNKLGVELRLNETAALEKIINQKPDMVIMAQGSRPKPFSFIGMDSDKITNPIDVISDKTYVGPRCVVIGGTVAGCEAALHLAMHRHKMTIVTKERDILTDEMPELNRKMLKDLLIKYKVSIIIEAIFEGVNETGALISVDGQNQELPAHHVIIDLEEEPVLTLYDALKDKGLWVEKIGDNREIGGVKGAIRSGFRSFF